MTWQPEQQKYNDLSPLAKEVFASYLENCSVECVLFRFSKEEVPIDGNKVGGDAYLPANAIYPYKEDEWGKRPMALLCQLNLEEVPPVNHLPAKGILQIFVDPLDYGNYFDRNTHKIVYISNPTKDFSQLVPPPDYHVEGYQLPFEGEWKISFEKQNIPLSSTIEEPGDFFENMLKKACAAKNIPYASLTKIDLDALGDIFEYEASGICQYPSDLNGIFIPEKYPRQILQIISERLDDEYIFLFLDAGTAHFFLPEGAMEKEAFSDSYYVCTCG